MTDSAADVASVTRPAQPGPNTRSGHTTSPSARAFIAAVAVVALACSLVLLHLPALHQSHLHLGTLAYAAIVAAAAGLGVSFEFRRHTFWMNFCEAALVIGLAFCSTETFVVGCCVGGAVAMTARRKPLARGIFNVATTTAGFTLARIAVTLGGPGAMVTAPRSWPIDIVAVAVLYAVSTLGVLIVMRLSGGSLPIAGVVQQMGLNLALSMAVGATGLLIAVVLATQPWAAILLGALIALLAAGYGAYTLVRNRYANLRLLYSFASVLTEDRTEDDVVRTTLNQSRTLLNAEYADLTVPVGTGWIRMSVDADGGVQHSKLDRIDSTLTATIDQGSLVINRAKSTRHPARHGAFRDMAAVPMAFDDRDGVLRVANRSTDVKTFDSEDIRLLGALAAHAAIALRNGQLLDRLSTEAATRAHQALHDSLTGLGNRTFFGERVDSLLAPGDDGHVAVMLMDLDEFKEINDTLGHHTGDSVLREVAARLLRAVGSLGTVARLGGDEFAVAIPGCTNLLDAVSFAKALRRVISEPVSVDDLTLEVRSSIGVAMSPDHGTETAILLQRADVAMYAAKSTRLGVEVYNAERDHYSHRRLALSSDLRQAMSNGDLELHFQPTIHAASGRVAGAEALLRWTHPRYGAIPPDEFIPVAEQSGLIQPLTRWVLGRAVDQLVEWRAAGLDLTIAVNLSARNLLDASLVEDVKRVLIRSNLPRDAVVLELTETSVMADPGRTEAVLAQLAELGCRLSIDDFGTGYSSLSRLKRLPVDEVKIDRSFVMHMTGDPDDAVIVRSIIELAHNLGMSVVAEGVEDADTLEALRALRCDVIQGYHLLRPCPAETLTEWLEDQDVATLPHLVMPRVAAVS